MQDLWAPRAFPATSLSKAQQLYLGICLPAVKARGISSMAQRSRRRILHHWDMQSYPQPQPGGRHRARSGRCPGGMCDMPHRNGQQKFKVTTPTLPK